MTFRILVSSFPHMRSCCVDEFVGTLETGKQADALVVNGNPVEDLSALRQVADVFLVGSRVNRRAFI